MASVAPAEHPVVGRGDSCRPHRRQVGTDPGEVGSAACDACRERELDGGALAEAAASPPWRVKTPRGTSSPSRRPSPVWRPHFRRPEAPRHPPAPGTQPEGPPAPDDPVAIALTRGSEGLGPHDRRGATGGAPHLAVASTTTACRRWHLVRRPCPWLASWPSRPGMPGGRRQRGERWTCASPWYARPVCARGSWSPSGPGACGQERSPGQGRPGHGTAVAGP